MKDRDILALITYSLLLWPNQRDVERREQILAWRGLLSDVDEAAARAVVDEYAATGAPFPPPPGLIRQRALLLVSQASAPSPEEAWEEVRRTMSHVGYSRTIQDVCELGRACSGETCDHHVVRFSHPAIQAVVDSIGWRELCLSSDTMADRAHFMKFYAVAVERLTRQIAKPPTMAALEATLPIPALDPPTQKVRALPSGVVEVEERDDEGGIEAIRRVRTFLAEAAKKTEDV